MSAVWVFVICSITSSLSYLLGAGIRNSIFQSQPWQLLRWDENILGYRVVPENYKVNPNDRVMMAVQVDAETTEVIG